VNCTPNLDCSKDEGKSLAEKASDEMVLEAVQALGEFSPIVSQPNHSDLSLTALDDALKRFYINKSVFQDQKMLKAAKAKVNEQLAGESPQLRERTFIESMLQWKFWCMGLKRLLH